MIEWAGIAGYEWLRVNEVINQTISDPLQGENRTFSDFKRRTDLLAHRLDLNLSEIPAKVGFSKSMLFAYRSGKHPVSEKVWRKLEDAEAEVAAKSENVRSHGNPKESTIPILEESSNVLRDEPVKYEDARRLDMPAVECPRIALLERAIDGMSAQLEVMKELVNQLKTKP